jgi:hypothetical protein
MTQEFTNLLKLYLQMLIVNQQGLFLKANLLFD